MWKFQLRYCPALAKKPNDNTTTPEDKPKPKPDPFANPSPELLIAEVHGGSHILVLNKYPVIPNHFILATKADKPQTDLLEREDLAVSLACLRAWREGAANDNEGQLFAFFNSGQHSGASQPHRHLQFLPVQDMKVNKSKWQDPDTFDWNPLILSMTSNYHELSTFNYTSNARLPIRHFAIALEDETPSSLHSKYINLLQIALAATKKPAEAFIEHDEHVEIKNHGQANFSYNLAMTPEIMAICPRRSESAAIPGLGDDHFASINGTILGGTFMVKEEEEWHTLRNMPHALDAILETIGYPTAAPSKPTILLSTSSSNHL